MMALFLTLSEKLTIAQEGRTGYNFAPIFSKTSTKARGEGVERNADRFLN